MPREAFPGLNALGYSASVALGINDSNHIVGYVGYNNGAAPIGFDYTTIRPAAWRNGQLEILSFSDGGYGEAIAINEAGQIVGVQFLDSVGSNRAFIHKEGEIQNLDDLLCTPATDGSHLTYATRINDRGEILAVRQLQGEYMFQQTHELLRPRVVSTTGGSYPNGSGSTCYPQ